MKRLLIIAAAVAALGLATVAVGGAVTSAQDGDGPIGNFLAKVAGKLGVSEDELRTAIRDARLETIDEALADGRITEEQAERLRERAAEGDFPFPRPGVCQRGAHFVLDAAAEVLDMPKEQLKEELRDGKSLAEVAQAEGMSVEEFEEALLGQVQTQLNQMVGEDKLSEDRADRIYQRIEENIESIVNAHPDAEGPCRPGHGPRGFGGPWQGPGPEGPMEGAIFPEA